MLFRSLLDRVLAREARYRAAFAAGVDHHGPVAWRDDHGDARFATLRARLRGGPPPDDGDPGLATARRLDRILGHRPMLAPAPDERPAIVAALRELVPRIDAATATVLTQVRAALDARPPGS